MDYYQWKARARAVGLPKRDYTPPPGWVPHRAFPGVLCHKVDQVSAEELRREGYTVSFTLVSWKVEKPLRKLTVIGRLGDILCNRNGEHFPMDSRIACHETQPGTPGSRVPSRSGVNAGDHGHY